MHTVSAIETRETDSCDSAIVNRPALGTTPHMNWVSLIESSIMTVAPKGLKQVFTAMCGSCANECAFKAVFMHHQHLRRGGKPFTPEELVCHAPATSHRPNHSLSD